MKLTFFIPVSTGRDIELLTSICLPSIFYFFDKNDLEEIILLVPEKEKELLYLYLKNKKINCENIKVYSDLIFKIKTDKTYYFQMFAKLKIAEFIKTDHYITFDSDNFLTKKCNSNSFFKNGKSIYTKINGVHNWMIRVMKYLDIKVNFCTNQTPFVFKKDLVMKMIKDIDVKNLIIEKQCSEYTLYQGYLIKNNLFDNNYINDRFSNVHIKNPYQRLNNNLLVNLFESFFEKEYVTGCIQSRINCHHRLKDSIKKYIPTSTYKPLRIAVVTIIAGEQYYKRYFNAIKIKQKYCKYHNYEFIYEKLKSDHNKKGWMKMYKLREILYSNKYDYIFISDADVVITNRDIRIEDLILKYMGNKSIILSTDFNSINTGNMIWKCDDNSKKFINQIFFVGCRKIRYSVFKPFFPKGVYEQPSIIYLYNTNQDCKKFIKIIPQFEINSYLKLKIRKNCLKKVCNKYNRCHWQPNDFLIHFAGLNYINNNKFNVNIDPFIKQYVKEYYKQISKKEGNDFKKII